MKSCAEQSQCSALVVALIAFGATAGMKALAGGLNTAFSNINTVLGTYTV